MYKKNTLLFILINLLVVIGCDFKVEHINLDPPETTKKSEFISIYVDGILNDSSFNKQMAKDLQRFPFSFVLKDEHPDFTENILNNLDWRCRNEDSNIHFQIKLNKETIKHNEIIDSIFRNLITTQASFLKEKKELFEEALDLSRIYAKQLDNKNINPFWNRTTEVFRSHVTKEKLIETIQRRKVNIGGNRIFARKTYFSQYPIPNIDFENLFVIQFLFDEDEEMYEEFIFTEENDSLNILGYTYRQPKNKQD